MVDEEWQAQLPSLIERSMKRWSLEVGEQLEGAYIADVRGCTGPHGEDLVLKISPPLANPTQEANALLHWHGRGAVRLVDWDEGLGALLLERIRPGTLLMDRHRSAHDDERAVFAASHALAEMQSAPAPHEGLVPSFEERLRWWLDYAATHGEPAAVGMKMLPQFEASAERLHATAQRMTLAHGDFIAKNVLLRADGRYIAIDPLPFVGDPASDVGQFSAYHSPVASVVPRARAIAEATDNDPDRAARWAAVWTVFQGCETWRDDSDDLQAWVVGDECQRLLAER